MYCEQNYTVAEIAYLLHYVILSSDYLSILPHNNYHLPHVSFFAAYWGCRTPDYTVNVYSPLKAALVCPIAVRPSEEFTCSAEFIEGSGIQSIQWKLDGAPNGAAITNVGGEPYLVSVYVGVGGGGGGGGGRWDFRGCKGAVAGYCGNQFLLLAFVFGYISL